MTSRYLLAMLLAFGVAELLAAPAAAQTVTATNDLQFGNIFPGIPKEVLKTEVGAAAEFFISGTAGAEVAIDFTLPTYMNMGGANMQMIFYETSAALDSSATPDQSSPAVDNLDPWQTITYRIGSAGLTIWLGGKLVPKLVQAPGGYAADIVVTVTYTGN
jgi:hypothetical protein